MKLVVDSNILISAFISDSTTRRLIRDLDPELYAPSKLKEEVSKYDDLIQDKSGLTERELERLKKRLFKHITFVHEEELSPHRETAKEIIHDTDPDDVIFVATALATDATIWSDDQDFQQQNQIPVLTTTELLNKTSDS